MIERDYRQPKIHETGKKYKDTKDLNLINQVIKILQMIEPEENGSLLGCRKFREIKKDLWDHHIKSDWLFYLALI